jgi:hypothetical protein
MDETPGVGCRTNTTNATSKRGPIGEHRLSEALAERNTVETAHEFAVLPRLGGVREAEVVQCRVRVGHVGGDPGARFAAARHFGAAVHDAMERGVDATSKPPRRSVLRNERDTTVPPVATAMRGSGENQSSPLDRRPQASVRVREQQTVRREIAADREQPTDPPPRAEGIEPSPRR